MNLITVNIPLYSVFTHLLLVRGLQFPKTVMPQRDRDTCRHCVGSPSLLFIGVWKRHEVFKKIKNIWIFFYIGYLSNVFIIRF